MPTRSSASSSCAVPTSSVPRPRWLCVAIGTSSRIRSTSSPKPASASRSAARPRTRPCAHGHALIPVASTPTTRRERRLRRGRDPDQRDHLLRHEVGHRRVPAQRPARDDPHLGAERILPLDDLRGDPVREHLDEQPFAEDDLVDRLVEELREARHVDALLVAREVDGAVDLGRHQDLLLAAADADRLVDAGHAGAREREPDGRRRRLHVADERELAHAAQRYNRRCSRDQRKSRESRRSLRIRPPVWQAGQYVIVCSSKSTRRSVSPQRGHGSPKWPCTR